MRERVKAREATSKENEILRYIGSRLLGRCEGLGDKDRQKEAVTLT